MRTIGLGDVTITGIVERDGPWRKPADFFRPYDPARALPLLEAMPPWAWDAARAEIVIRYQSFLVRTPRHAILIDTCTGQDKGYPPPLDFPKQPWLDAFRATGLRFDDVTHIFCTHLHMDHCGWNTRLDNGRWVPTFPRAAYIFHRAEYAAWEELAARGEERAGGAGGVWSMNCRPVVEAGQALLVDDAYALDDLITLIPTPGHSPGHCCVALQSAGRRAVVTGDLMHHPLQCAVPDWSTIFCWDGTQAAATRREVLGRVADTGTLLLPIHFSGSTAGHVTRAGDAFRYAWADA